MRVLGPVVGLVIALGIGYFVLQRSVTSGPGQITPPQQQIDVIAIRQRLITIGQAERQYLVTHGTYATLEDLNGEDLLPGGTEQRGYSFTAITFGNSQFTITATPTDADKTDWPTLEINESMQVTER